MRTRSISVTIKMTEQDFKLLTRASAKIAAPEVTVTKSSLILALAKIGAKKVLGK